MRNLMTLRYIDKVIKASIASLINKTNRFNIVLNYFYRIKIWVQFYKSFQLLNSIKPNLNF